MPVPHDRHAKANAWDWAVNQPSRSQQRAAAAADSAAPDVVPADKRPPSRLKKGACKGPDGWYLVHKPVIGKATDQKTGRIFDKECGWRPKWHWLGKGNGYEYQPAWICYHESVCERCGHVLAEYYTMGTDCPEYSGQPVPEQVLADCERKTDEYRARVLTRPFLKKAPVTGRQSYRKPKDKGKK